MPRGGRRTGTPGVAYGARTDLQQPIATGPSQQYGERAAQVASQRAIPMARPATDAVPGASSPAPGTASGPGGPPQAPGPLPGQVIPLDAPTTRPGEPITAGMPIGPGAGPEALGVRVGPEQTYQTARDHVAMLARSQPDNDALQYLLGQLGVSF